MHTSKPRNSFRRLSKLALVTPLLATSFCGAKVSSDGALAAVCERTLEVEADHRGALAEVESQRALDFIYVYLYTVDAACGRVD